MTGEGKKSLVWHFPPTSGGVEQDFNHAGQESFKAKEIWNNVIREIIQNSLDAAATDTRPVHVDIDLVRVPASAVGAESLAGHIRSVFREAQERRHDKAVRTYRNALERLGAPELDVLAITDSGTTGLLPKNLDALVYREGASEKQGNSGGSFGIGKYAPFLASAAKTVCYCTAYGTDGKRAERFIGKAILSAHDDPAGGDGGKERLQHAGFGTGVPVRRGSRAGPVCDGGDIPGRFRLGSAGTGVFVICFEPPIKKWKQGAVQSAAKNFFAAIQGGRLTVSVSGERLDKDCLGPVMERSKHDSLYYYDAIRNPDGRKTVHVRDMRFEVRYVANRDQLPNRVAYINRRGMIITASKQRGTNPFAVSLGPHVRYAAVLQASDDRTDQVIRGMEPPSHNSIDPERITSEAERKDHEVLLSEIRKKVEGILEGAVGDALRGDTLEADETIEFFPIRPTAWKGRGPDNWMQLATAALPVPREPGTGEDTVRSDEAGRGAAATHAGGASGAGGTGAGTRSGNTGRTRTGSSHMVRRRSIRSGEWLRVSFDNIAKVPVSLRIRSAGEDSRGDRSLPVGDAQIHPRLEGTVIGKDGWITIPPCQDRMMIDVRISSTPEYSGYEIVERLADAGGTEDRNPEGVEA